MVNIKETVDMIGVDLTSIIHRLNESKTVDQDLLHYVAIKMSSIEKVSRVLLGEIILEQIKEENNECGVDKRIS